MFVSDLSFSVFARTLSLFGYRQPVHPVKSARILVIENGNEKCFFTRRQVVR